MNSAALPAPQASRNGRLMLALIVGLLALPFAIAAGLYFGGWQPARGIQHGQLLQPPAPLPASGLRTPTGQMLASIELQGKWWLALSIDGPCSADCARRIDEMRRIQVSLNKDMGRLRRLVLSPQTNDPELLGARQRQPDLQTLQAPAGWLGGGNTAGHLHVIDPLGQRVIDYPPEVSAREIRTDLERLLKFAWTG